MRRAGAGRRITPGVLIAVALGLGGAALVAVQAGRGVGEGALQAGDDGAAAAGRVATGPARAGESLFDRVGAMWSAAARVQQLERENRELQTWRELAERLAERNRRYEALLRMPANSFGEGADIERSIAAQLVLDSGGPFTRTLVANAGAEHGVRVGFVALNENGLVGRVVSVGRRTSRVLMLDDYTSRIPVLGESSRVRAVLAGQATRPPELISQPYQVQAPRLDFIVGAQDLREGERIITSGDGGLFPRGIPVGVAQGGRDGQWRVSLSAAQRPIDFVRLVPFVGLEAPEQTLTADAGPPPGVNSSVAVVRREVMTAPPSAPTPAPRPRIVLAPRADGAAPAPSPSAAPPSAPSTPEPAPNGPPQ